jgi:hypothetical protein
MTMIDVETSCGKSLRTPVNEMSNWQLQVLLKQNEHRNDVDPRQLAAMRDELKARIEKLRDAFWPPLNSDPKCERCGGTGYARSCDKTGTVSVGRCQCNVDRLV